MSFGTQDPPGFDPASNALTHALYSRLEKAAPKISYGHFGSSTEVPKQPVSALPSLRNDTLAQVIIGEQQASFYVHRNLICKSSSFFKAALSGSFKEATEGKVILPEDDPDVFEQFVQWVYTKAYNLSPLADSSSENLCKHSWQYVRLFVFAEKAQAKKLKDQVLRDFFAFRQRHGNVQLLTYDCVEFAYDHTGPESGLRRLLVAMSVWTDAKIDSEAIAALPELASEVAAGLQERVHSPNLRDPFEMSADLFFKSTKQLPQTTNTRPTFGGLVPRTGPGIRNFGGGGFLTA